MIFPGAAGRPMPLPVGGGGGMGRRPMPVGPAPAPVGGGFGDAPRQPRPIGPAQPILGTFHKGGMVKKSGVYKLKKGEKVLSLADLAKAKK